MNTRGREGERERSEGEREGTEGETRCKGEEGGREFTVKGRLYVKGGCLKGSNGVLRLYY